MADQSRAPKVGTVVPDAIATSRNGPNLSAATEHSALELLLGIEEQARLAADETDLLHLIVNETRKLNRARQIFLVEIGTNGRPHLRAISGISSFDPHAILADNIIGLISRLSPETLTFTKPIEFTLPAFTDPQSDLAQAYPFREMAWVPFLRRDGVSIGGMLAAREGVWTSNDIAITHRLARTYAHAWRELKPVSTVRRLHERAFTWRWGLAVMAIAALLLPFPLTALAPVEIVARDPVIVSTPIDGVIERIEVDPSARVKVGDVLISLADTALRNRREIAAQEVALAQARVKVASLSAFADVKGRHELGIAEAELELKRSEFNYASDLLAKTSIRATRDGIAIFADRRSLVGRPVSTGERLMEIADGQSVEARIDVAIPDAIALRLKGHAKLFLDVEPLRPWSAHIERADYKARPSDTDVLSYRSFAMLDPSDAAPPRIGLRGTAQIYGDYAPLGIVLLRRPISAVRQWLGL